MSQTQNDLWEFVLSPGADPAADERASKVLEVLQICGDAVLDVRHFERGHSVTVGMSTVGAVEIGGIKLGTIAAVWRPMVDMLPLVNAEDVWRNAFFVPEELLPQADFPLLSAVGESWTLNLRPEWQGFIEEAGQRSTFAELVAQGRISQGGDGLCRLVIPDEGQVVVDLGGPIFVARRTAPSRRLLKTLAVPFDATTIGSAGFAAVLFTLLGTALSVVPSPPKNQAMELDPSVVTLYQQMMPKPAEAGGSEEAAAGKEGAAKPVDQPVRKVKSPGDRTAKANGLLGALASDGELAGLLNQSGLSDGLMAGVGGLIGSTGTQQGTGLGMRGNGLGGGGNATGIGGIGPGTRPGGGGSGGEFREKESGSLASVGGEAIILGGLDKSLIDAVIKQNLSRIRYCYQRELVRSPSLAGRVTVRFIIAKDGSVSSATTKTSSLGAPNVESCINSKFMQFRFPEPKGGGIVIVTYPFLFAAN